LLGLGYPGGPIVDKLSTHGDPNTVKFPPSQLKHRDRNDRNTGRTYDGPRFDFSYSGIKTAVLRHVETHHMQASIAERRKALLAIQQPKLEDYVAHCDRQTLDLVASFQRAVVEDLAGKTLAAARAYDVATLFITGGVAANQALRQQFEKDAAREGISVYFPSRPLSTDNAAMIAAAACPKFLAREFATMDFSAEAGMVLK
jgi:N6-L-threonylcarbamoyladenine synthase